MTWIPCRLNAEAVLILVDGSAALPAAPLHEPMWYALYYFLRDVGTLAGSFEEFISHMTSADTTEVQLEMLNHFQPDQDRMLQEDWDTAVYDVLARAEVIKGLISRQTAQVMIDAPVVLMQSGDAVGRLFDRATRAWCCTAMQHIKLEQAHAECMLSKAGLQAIACHVTRTTQASLRLT